MSSRALDLEQWLIFNGFCLISAKTCPSADFKKDWIFTAAAQLCSIKRTLVPNKMDDVLHVLKN